MTLGPGPDVLAPPRLRHPGRHAAATDFDRDHPRAVERVASPLMRARLLPCLAPAWIVALLLVPAGPAGAAVPRPLARGPHATARVEYEAGSALVSTQGIAFEQPLEGSVHVPQGPGPWRVLLFLHGNH